jgi:hypothetical protein
MHVKKGFILGKKKVTKEKKVTGKNIYIPIFVNPGKS